ncbi:MAG: 50S ribosomal protein L32 [Patescibacteria group bacterium]
MAVPRHRHTKGKRNKVRMHLYIKPAVLTVCPKCKKPVRPHTICKNCGFYKGKKIIDVLKNLTRKNKKAKEKEIKAAEKQEKQEKPITMEELSKK